MTATGIATAPNAAVAKPPPARNGVSRRVAVQVARVESRLLMRAATLPAALAVLMSLGSGGDLVDLRAMSFNAAFNVLLLAAVVLVASHRAVTRARRDGTEELLEAAPAAARARTAGHLLAVAAPTVLAGAVIALVAGPLRGGDRSVGALLLPELAVSPMLVAGAGCLGVLLARMWPQPVTPYLACVAIAVAELAVNTPALAGSGARWLVFWVEGSLWWLLPRHSWAHLLYLSGLVAMAAVGALIRHGVTRRLVAAGTAAIGVTVLAASLQMRQPQDVWRATNAMFAEPASVQRCWTRSGVEYCAFPRFAEVMDHVAGMVEAVLPLFPEQARPTGLEVAQRVTALDLQYFGDAALPHVPALPRSRVRQPDDGRLHPGLEFGWGTVQELGFGVQVAAKGIGLPLVPDPRTGETCVAARQARAVVALWAGAHATDDARDGLTWLLRLAEEAAGPRLSGSALLPVAEADVYGGFVVSVQDMRVALALLERDKAVVRAGVARSWELLSAPTTTTADLARVLDVPLPGDAGGAPFLAHPDRDAVRLGARCQ